MENPQDTIDQKFNQIVNKRAPREKRPPAKFPEIRYLWGITLIGSFALMIISAVISTIIDAL
jgi:hypothetical protein